ncbi:MAG: AAA family ATPase [Eubacteriales bacterium]|nr:AAA family ATPase [Eubacteriales bacterium]
MTGQTLLLITGPMAAGKSTVAQLIAQRLPRCVHLRGDIFRRMMVTGREEMSERPTQEALRQLALRYDLTAQAAKGYYDAGFSVVLQDNYYGRALPDMLERLAGYPVKTVVLCPKPSAICRREAARGKVGYTGFSVESLYASFMAQTPRLGLWLDTSAQTAQESADEICRQLRLE